MQALKVVDGEYRGGRIRELEKAAHALETPARVNRYVCDERRIEPDPCVRQGGFVASATVARSRNFVGFGDEADAAVTKRDQVLDARLTLHFMRSAEAKEALMGAPGIEPGTSRV